MSKRPPSRSDNLRNAVAQEAARLMAEHGINDYLIAKRKAAERYGVADGPFLPRNSEIEEALASYQRLFGGEQHATSLQRHREIALKAMQLLEKFNPRLTGSVLNGTATSYSDIQLHVFSDSAELVYLRLADKRYKYDVIERKLKMTSDRWTTVPTVKFEMESEIVEVFVFPTDGVRQAPVSPVDAKPLRRADLQEVRLLILNVVDDIED